MYFSPARPTFGAALGETHKLQVKLRNTTTTDLVLTGQSITGANAADFKIASKTCGASLAAGAFCSYTLVFTSSHLAPRNARLEVSTGDPAFPVVKTPLKGNPYPVLNDTGITGCGDADSNDLPCPVTGFPRQDAEYGRDKTRNVDGNGHAGFNFTKLDAEGQDLPASAKTWNCVRDNVTGLVWEKKPVGDGTQGNQGLHDADDRYTWYSTDSTNNNGSVGYPDQSGNRACSGYSFADSATFCNTEAYVNRVNAAGWCGAKDWRMPTRKELRGLVDLSIPYPGPTIDTVYFPDTEADWHWSGSPNAYYSGGAWLVTFGYGDSSNDGRSGAGAVRLVRGGQ